MQRYRSAAPRRSRMDFDVPVTLGNVDRLPQSLAIDGVRFAPNAFLVADDIVVGTGVWPSRHDASKTMTVVGSGTSPTYGNATAIENSAVRYATAQKYHSAADKTWGQLSDKDFAIELVYIHKADLENVCFGTWNGVRGFTTYNNGVNQLTFYFNDGSATVQGVATGTPTTNAIYHLLVFGDRSENLYVYVNGILSDYKSLTGMTGTLTGTSGNLAFGYYGAGELVQYGLWDLVTNPLPGALKNRTYLDRIARERFAFVAGIQEHRQGAHTFARATSAYLDRYISSTERRAFRAAAGWPRVCTRKDTAGNLVREYLAEPQATNQLTYSEDLTQTGSWTRSELTTVTAAAAAGPDGYMTLNGLVANTTDTSHYIRQTYTTPATLHAVSWFARKGDKDWILANVTSVSNVYAYWNANTGAWGTIGAGVTAYGAEDWGGGLYRAWLIFTGNAAAIQYQFYSAPSDGATNFAGDATTVNTYLGCVQVEAVTEHFPSSYIPTAAAAVVRNKDELSYMSRFPIVGNIADLPQALNIGGTDYAPCAFLNASDCQADGTWTSRHAAKSMAFSGAGTNPTPGWDSVGRANKTVKYWGSNYHTAADTTWGQITTGDAAVECVFRMISGGVYVLFSTYNAATTTGYDFYINSNYVVSQTTMTGTPQSVQSATAIATGTLVHAFVGIDSSDKQYMFINGIYSASNISIPNITGTNLSIGIRPNGTLAYPGEIAHIAMWDLTTNPWPGVGTNQAVMGAIARARFAQVCRYQACLLAVDVLHPNTNRQGNGTFILAGNSTNDYNDFRVDSTDLLIGAAGANGATQWLFTGGSDICNGAMQRIACASRADNARLQLNGTTISTDASCELPAGMMWMMAGSNIAGGVQPGCGIANLRLWRRDR